MCGICGKLYFESNRPVEKRLVEAMCNVLRHRGPDDMGMYTFSKQQDGNVNPGHSCSIGLGQTRLSIIDLTTGHQPIHNENKTVWVVLNGEIYNFQALKSELVSQGHRFYTSSDTEVIVHLYEEYGNNFVQHINGMFAIAIWDEKRRRLVLLRDRIGIKPLYYFVGNDGLLFASEIKAILQDEVEREVDIQALWNYLSYNYIPSPLTIFKGIRKLSPGTMLIWEEGELETRKYWDITSKGYGYESDSPVSEEDYEEGLLERLKEAVRLQLISDVPLGVFLSGGLDSSTIVALIREVSNNNIKTFSIGFEDKSYDELDFARSVAGRFETDHHELVVRMNPEEILPKLVYHFDEPFADFSAIPVYYLSEMTRRHVTVALGGDGGDELFAGYETYSAYVYANLYKRLPGVLSRGIIPRVVSRLPVSLDRVSFDYKAKRFVKGALLSPLEGHYRWKVIFDEDAKRDLCCQGSGRDSGIDDSFEVMRGYYEETEGMDTLSRLQYVDFKAYLPDDILTKVDRMSMANSLEVRPPFLDHNVAEYSFRIPANLRLHGFKKKYILKRIMRDRLPQKVLHGRKGGFNVPVPKWLLNELHDVVHDLLSVEKIRNQGFFNADYVKRMVEDHEKLRVDFSRNIWGLLIFTLWHDRWMK
ncbi:MAG TPA: asparagine synthase (glutamine-hydrolyzing) [Nitrospirae bacterium]|nr:asparagine synthase (glutamine-hydrolyzing) [Nitrospirota bacterium]